MIYYLGFIPVIVVIILANFLNYDDKEIWQPVCNMTCIIVLIVLSTVWAINGLIGGAI